MANNLIVFTSEVPPPYLSISFLTKFHRSPEGLGVPFIGLCMCM